MPLKNQALTITYVAWDTGANAPKAGDAANHTIRAVGDGAEFTPAATPTEVDAANLKGVYKLALLASEMNYNCIAVGGASSTAGIVIYPVLMFTDRGTQPTAAPNSAGGFLTVGTGSGQISPSAGLVSLAPAGLDQIAVETGINARQALSPILAAAAGALSGATTSTVAIAAANSPTTNRITASVDGSGNRTAITLNLPA